MEKEELDMNMPTEVAEEQGNEEQVKTSHKENFLSKLREERGEDFNPSDDELWDISGENWNAIKGEKKKMQEINDKLASLISKDGRLGMLISKIVSGVSVPKAIGIVYGKALDMMSDDEMEEYEQGYNEYNERQNTLLTQSKEAEENLKTYFEELDKYGEAKGYSDEQIDKLHENIYEFAYNILNGKIPVELIESLDKAENYDKDVKEASETGLVEGRNQNIEAQMDDEDLPISDDIPDLTDANSLGGVERVRPRNINKGIDMDDFPIGGTSGQQRANSFQM